VSDLSAKGLIFISCDLGYRIRQPLFAFITFPDGTVVAVEGTILRMKIDQVIVRLTRGISTERILEESKRHQERNRPDSK